MDITAHIRELLFGHDCVIVPGFGGFIGNYTPARIDKSTSTFYPPVKQISFNRNLNNNDGLLIGKISGSCGLSYSEARNLVEQFVEDVTRELAKGEKVVFDHIGSFINNHEGNIQFEPNRESNYHLNAYGLASFQFMPLEGYDVRKRVVRHIEKEPIPHTPLRKYLWKAAIIVPLLGILITIPLTTSLFKTKVQSTNLNPLASVELNNNRSAVENKKSDTGLPVAQPSADTSNQTSVKTEESVTKQTGPEADMPAGMFYIITGSFQSENNANALLKKLSDEGYSPELVKGPNGFYRVSALRCGNLAEANQKRDSIGQKYSGTWVTRIK